MANVNSSQTSETSGQSPYFAIGSPVDVHYGDKQIESSSNYREHSHTYGKEESAVERIYLKKDESAISNWISYSTLVICNSIWTSVLFGYSLGNLNSCMNSIALYFQWCENAWDAQCGKSEFYQAVINAILFLGAVIGSLTSGRLVALGRRFSLQVACCIFICGGLLGAASFGSHAWLQLCAARILVGIGLGLVTVATPLYISEMTPPHTRGFFGTMHQTLIGVGIFISIALGLPLSPNSTNDMTYTLSPFDHWWWRFMLGFQCLPAFVCLFGFLLFCRDETPHYLIHSDRTMEAAQTIMKTYGAAHVIQIEVVLLEITQAVHEAKGLTEITLCEALQERYYRFGLLLGFFLAALQQLSGINVIISSSDSLFAMAGLGPDAVTMTSTIMAFSNALSSAIAALFIENLGRRKLLLWGMAGQILFMLPTGLVQYGNENHSWWLPASLIFDASTTWLSVISTIGFVTSFSVALGPIVWIYLSEIYPVEIRGMALGICGAINWISAFFVVFVGRFLHVTTAFITFGVICTLGFICSYLWVIETKGTSIEDSPVSPQSLRISSQLIQSSRLDQPGFTLEDLREKIRSSASYPSDISKCQFNTFNSIEKRFYINHNHSHPQLHSLGVDPCLIDDDLDLDTLGQDQEYLDHDFNGRVCLVVEERKKEKTSVDDVVAYTPKREKTRQIQSKRLLKKF